MQKIYKYGNGMVYVNMSEIKSDQLHESTVNFLRKVLKERIQNGNSNKSSNIREK